MFELLTGTGLAVAAGLNAYIPLLVLGLAGRFTDFVTLPSGWTWLENPWVLGILGVLLVIEIVADKIPVVDSINDWLQTIVRPAAGGIVFGTGAASQTAAVKDPAAFFSTFQWVPIVVGIVLALFVHGAKMASRPALNALTLGAAAPVASTAEDFSSIALSVLALVLPLLVLVALFGIVVAFVALFRRAAIARKREPAYEFRWKASSPEA
ncbi:MAG: DUF4126 domain-containing protein [Rhodoglobus sp.]